MAKADAARIEALAYQVVEFAFDHLAGDMSSEIFADYFRCEETDIPAIIAKARELLPKRP